MNAVFRVLAHCALGAAIVSVACRRGPDAPPPPLTAQVSGTLEVEGLSDAVRIVRDRHGIPHIYARTRDDLFFAQGFVQAQDRLFQMDLWRRSVQGRLSEVLGPNFIERDAMTRRIQYRGDVTTEWSAYGGDAHAIAAAFVRGVNAWVARARERPPEAFVLAGWIPDAWAAADLLNRTDAFLASGDAIEEIRRAGISDVVADAVRRIGTPPFLSGLAAQVRSDGNAEVRPQAPFDAETVRLKPPFDAAQGGREALERPDTTETVRLKPDTTGATARVARGGVLSVSEMGVRFDHPALRYIVHLNAPGWNVVGATRPWLPGVAVGHNDRVAWAPAAMAADTQDIYVERPTTLQRTIVKDAIVVKGRKAPFEFEVELTPHGVVIAADREHDRVFVLRWSGTEAGGAAELGALALNRAASWDDFRRALAAWRMPARRVVFADRDGNIGYQDVALVPVRTPPARSDRSERSRVDDGEWNGWTAIDALPSAYNPRAAIGAGDIRQNGTRTAGPILFAHVLAITPPARARFNVGPMTPAHDGSTLRAVFDPREWDRSSMIVAPGQSESPDSPHFRDLAIEWARGEMVPLAFSDAAVQANAESTLTLVPRPR